MKKILVTLLAFVSLSAFANGEWLLISQNKEKTMIVEGKKGSFTIRENGGSIITRTTPKNKPVFFNVVFMSKKDCDDNYGKVYYYDTNEKFEFSSAYVQNGGTIASADGDLICALLNKPNV